ncbi:hypothetical protein EG867_16310 [Enterococcus faecalis]|nr:hypothetical protein EG867_16310 [Enterococcus faecalis]
MARPQRFIGIAIFVFNPQGDETQCSLYKHFPQGDEAYGSLSASYQYGSAGPIRPAVTAACDHGSASTEPDRR